MFPKVHEYDVCANLDDSGCQQLSPVEPEAVQGRVLVQQQQGNTTPTIHQSHCRDKLCLESEYHRLAPGDTSLQSVHLTPLVVVTTSVQKQHGTNLELQWLSPIQNYSSPHPSPTRHKGLLVHSNRPSLHLTPELRNTDVILRTMSPTSFSSSSSLLCNRRQTTSPGRSPLAGLRVNGRFPHPPALHLTPELRNTGVILKTTSPPSSSSSLLYNRRQTTSPGISSLAGPRVRSRFHNPLTPSSSSIASKNKPTTLQINGPGTNSHIQHQSVFRSPVTGFYPDTEYLSPRSPHHGGPSIACFSVETLHPNEPAADDCCQKVGREWIELYDTRPLTRGRRVSSWIRKKVVRFRRISVPDDTGETTADDDSASADKDTCGVRPTSPFLDVLFH
jgi:hypothetical protein